MRVTCCLPLHGQAQLLCQLSLAIRYLVFQFELVRYRSIGELHLVTCRGICPPCTVQCPDLGPRCLHASGS